MIKITKLQLEKGYINHKLTDAELSEKYNCSSVWIMILRKKYKIKSLKPYERNSEQNLSPKQLEFILGSLLGDASIKFGGRIGNKNAFLCISQTDKALTEFKYKIIKNFVKIPIKIYYDKRPNRKPIYYFYTISHPLFTKMYREIYINGVKTITKEWLDKLTPFSLAIWYMDDGSVTRNNHNMRISTESFSYKEHVLIKEYFERRWGISAIIKQSPKEGKFILSFQAEERDEFFKLIEPFIISEMQYKLWRNLRSWRRWTSSEIDYLRRNYKIPKTNWGNMFRNINHSKQAILKKTSYLSL